MIVVWFNLYLWYSFQTLNWEKSKQCWQDTPRCGKPLLLRGKPERQMNPWQRISFPRMTKVRIRMGCGDSCGTNFPTIWLDVLIETDARKFFRMPGGPSAFIVARSLRKWFHWYFTRIGRPIYIRRQGDVGAMNCAAAVLRSGGVVSISPEGRFDYGKLIKAHTSAAHLAAPAPILPTAIYGQDKAVRCWKQLRRAPIHVCDQWAYHNFYSTD